MPDTVITHLKEQYSSLWNQTDLTMLLFHTARDEGQLFITHTHSRHVTMATAPPDTTSHWDHFHPLITSSFSSSPSSSVSPDLSWRSQWCRRSLGSGRAPAGPERMFQTVRKTEDGWTLAWGFSSGFHSLLHSPEVWLWNTHKNVECETDRKTDR